MKRLITTQVLFFCLVSLVYGQTPGVSGGTLGLSLNGHLNGSAWTFNDLDVDAEAGGGIGIGVGYGISELITLYAELDAASINPEAGDNYTLAHFDLGAQFIFLSPANPFRPYADVALSGRAARWEFLGADVEASGAGLSLGGGMKYFFSPPFALDLNLKWTVGELSEIKIGSLSREMDTDATSARFAVGISWYPGR